MDQSRTNSHKRAGLIIAALMIVLRLLTVFLMEGKGGSILQWLTYVVAIGGIVYFTRLYGQSINHQSTFGNYFAYGFKITAVFTAIMVIFMIILNLAFPELRERGMDLARQSLVEQKKMTEEQVKQALEFGKKYFWPLTIAGELFGNLILGVAGSLLGAALTRKTPVHPVQQNL